MKHSIILLFCCAIIVSQAHATDRVVSPSGTYNTITSAIAASSNGDRVLVEPAVYSEHILLTKSLSILSNQEGAKFTVNGQFRCASASAPTTIYISGIRGSFIAYGSARLDLTITDSYITGTEFDSPQVHIELYRDSLPYGIHFYSGSLFGNVIGSLSTNGTPLELRAGTALPDPFRMIGNIVVPCNNSGSSNYDVDLAVSSEFHIENNYVSLSGNVLAFLRVTGTVPFGTATSTVVNNTFYRNGSANQFTINGTVPLITVNIQNNAVIGNTNTIVDWAFINGKNSNNLYAAPSWINSATGQPTVSSPLLNAGDPDPRYLDLDLTTNDVGCYGGSNSRANFTTPMGSAVVGFMQAPRVVSQGDAVNISATGFDR